MKKILYTTIIFITVVLVYIFMNSNISLDFSISNLRVWVGNSQLAPVIFIALWIIRLVAFIPGMTLMLLGGIIFSPLEAFILSLIGLVISDSLVFLLGKARLFKGFRNNLNKKYSDILILIQKYDYKFLALGVLCPVAPTDAICYLSSYLGIGYLKYIFTFIIANTPALILYSYLGESFQDSIYNTIFIIVTLLATGLLSLKVWNKLKYKAMNTPVN